MSKVLLVLNHRPNCDYQLTEKKKEAGSKNYSVGNVGDNVTFIQGDHNVMIVELLSDVSINDDLKNQFKDLMQQIDKNEDLDQDEKEILLKKTKEVAETLTKASDNPETFYESLKSTKKWFEKHAKWAWGSMKKIIESDNAKKIWKTAKDTGVLQLITAILI